MDYKKRFEETIKKEIIDAQKASIKDGVFICIDPDNKVFQFVKLEDVIFNDMPLSTYLSQQKDRIDKLEKQVEAVSDTLIALAGHIDKSKFL